MCSDNPNLPKEANKAKCFVVACFVFSIFSMIGFAGGTPGIVGALCGILACVASSILLCCAPKSTEEGGGKFTAAGVLLIIAGVLQLIMGVVVIVQLIVALNVVDDSSYCKDNYSTCTFDDSFQICTDGYCFKDPDDASPSRVCVSESTYDFCKDLHGGVKAAVTGILVAIFGIVAGFLLIAGILNTIGGAYCINAKKAIDNVPKAPTGVAQIPTAQGMVM